MSSTKPRRQRFNSNGILVASSNIVRVSLIKRFEIICRYRKEFMGVGHSTLTFNKRQDGNNMHTA